MPLSLTAPAFPHGGEIPSKFTCDDEDCSPALAWTDGPDATRTFALIVDDPDAPDPASPKMTWVHWVLYNIPGTAHGLPQNIGSPDDLPAGTQEGINDWKRTGYGGPCPPIGRHRYFFKLFALDTELALEKPTKSELEEAMRGHILEQAELIGTYQKQAI